MSRGLCERICEDLVANNIFRDNKCPVEKYRFTAKYKVFACIYFLAHGGPTAPTVHALKVSHPVFVKWLTAFHIGVKRVYGPRYMRKPTPQELVKIKERFGNRRGLSDVATTGDGSHVPYNPKCSLTKEDYKNYKGWYSILVFAIRRIYYA